MEVADPAIHMPDLSSAARVKPSFAFGRFEEKEEKQIRNSDGKMTKINWLFVL